MEEKMQYLENIIMQALVDKWIDKRTGEEYIKLPNYKIESNNVIHIYSHTKPYKLVILRRLLYIAKIPYNNIIVGNPDV